MTEISQLCAPIEVYQEDVRENRVTAQRRKERLQESSRTPGVQDRGRKMSSHLATTLEGKDRQDKGGTKFTRLTQQDSSQSLRRGNMPSEKRDEGMPKLVELYQCPRFLDDMPLPHNTAFSTIITHVVKGQRHLVHKPRYRAIFQNILSSARMEYFVTDCFWWLFLQSFQPDAQTQDNLFMRIAENYIQILTQGLSCRSGSRFLREFPSTLAQTLYCCFCCSFPQSCSTIRSDAFLLPLCSTAYQWTGGICPAPDVYKKWDFKALEPEEATNVEFVSGNERSEKESGSCLSLLEGMFSSTCVNEPFQPSSSTALTRSKLSLLQDNRQTTSRAGSQASSRADSQTSCQAGMKNQLSRPAARSRWSLVEEEKAVGTDKITGTDLKVLTGHGNQKLARESHVAYPGTEFRRSVFNVYGYSPLVQFYMNMIHMDPHTGQDVLVVRTEIHKLPPEGSVTYRHLLTEAKERSSGHRANLRRMWAQYAQDVYSLNQKRLDERYQLIRKQKKILSQRATVHRLCQLLVPERSNEEDTRSHSQIAHVFESAVSCLD